MGEFIDELLGLVNHGIMINGVKREVSIHYFVCDVPAKSFIKNTKGHSGYSSCDKCEIVGDWEGKVIFLDENTIERTNTSFRSQSDESHHKGLSPLLKLPIDMVNSFPIDFMHCVSRSDAKNFIGVC